MTTQFEDSLELRGKAADFSSTVRLPSPPETDIPSPPKRKRGRPRKAIPLDALVSIRMAKTEKTDSPPVSVKEKPAKHSSVKRLRKKSVPKSDIIEDEYFDLDLYGDETPFLEEELSTLEEFEKLSKTVRNEGRSANQKRIDKPSGTPTPVALPRRKKVTRRRQIDPATCERDYSADEIEFMNALSEYKRSSGRMFPTCSEILEVLRGLGYEKRNEIMEFD